MNRPASFSWVDSPTLAASGIPLADVELRWLRQQGIDIVLTLTEDPLPSRWVDEAGLMSVHVPVPDMEAPSMAQLERCIATIDRAKASKMGVLVHCMAGRGRTGTILAAYLAKKGMKAEDAIRQVRLMRPGSIETPEQERAVFDFADRTSES